MSKLKSLVLQSQEAPESLDKALEEHTEALEGLHLWSAVNTVAQAVVDEVKNSDKSTTLDALHNRIQELYKC